MSQKTILGIDPGLASTGWAILEFEEDKIDEVATESNTLFDGDYKPDIKDYGTVTTDSDTNGSDRVFHHYQRMNSIIRHHKPDIISMEDQFSHLNPSTLKKLSHVRGAYMSLAAQYDIECYLYYPTSVKKIASGSGKASKTDMVKNINDYFDMNLNLGETRGVKMQDDIADAISTVLSYLIAKEKGKKI